MVWEVDGWLVDADGRFWWGRWRVRVVRGWVRVRARAPERARGGGIWGGDGWFGGGVVGFRVWG